MKFDLSNSQMKALLLKLGAERISNGTSKLLGKILEEEGIIISKSAVKYTKQRRAKITRSNDIKKAYEEYRRIHKYL